ncbi:MAG: DUF4160 domain-containing protein [bacterium]
MSLTVFREKGYRFYFLSNEENRIHIHVTCEDGEAKFNIVEEHRDEIIKASQKHFGKR